MPIQFHIIQIGLDEDVFDENAPQDSRSRQITYAQNFKKINKNFHLTNIVLTENCTFKKEELEDVTFIPCPYYRLRHIFSLVLFLKKFSKNNKVLLLTTQDIHGIFWGAVIFSRMAKIPVIGQIHYDFSSPYARKELFVNLYGWLYKQVTFRLFMKFNGIRVVNSATKKYLEALGYKKPVCICPVPVATFSISEPVIINRWRLPGALRVLFVGRFVQVKNLDCWLETAKKAVLENRNIEFALIGDGAEKERLERYCDKNELSDRIQFVGALTPKQLAHWYASADVLLLTSNHEGFGRVVVEAMNYNIVPVSTNTAGPKEIITHGVNGFLDEANPGFLVKYLTDLEKNRDKLKAMGRCASDTVKVEYSPEKLKRRWVDFQFSFVHKPLNHNNEATKIC